MRVKNNESSVIVLHEQSTDALILTRRALSLRVQPGEFCFPGGGREKADKTLYDTALRELKEELGIDPSRVSLVREMKPEKTVFHKVILPWYATINQIDPYKINEIEVSELIKIPMIDVLNKDNYINQPVKKYGLEFSSLVFTASEHFVWGVTARMMRQLC